MRRIFLILILMPLALSAQEEEADSSELRAEAALFSNAPSFPLGGKVFVPPYHPGVDLGASGPFRMKEQGRWEWSTSLAYYYHRLSHHGIHLRGGVRYRQTGSKDEQRKGFSWEFALKGGYLHLLSERPSYEFDEESGEYERTSKWGRPQFSLGLATGPAYRIPNAPRWEFFMNYRIWAQMPFVKEYVPILPNVGFHLGARFELPSKIASQ